MYDPHSVAPAVRQDPEGDLARSPGQQSKWDFGTHSLATVAISAPSANSLWASRSLPITCSGVCLRCCTVFILFLPTMVGKKNHSGGSIRRGQVNGIVVGCPCTSDLVVADRDFVMPIRPSIVQSRLIVSRRNLLLFDPHGKRVQAQQSP